MPTVSELTVKIDADVSGVEKGVAQAEKSVGGFGASMKSGLGMGAGFGLVGKGIELLGGAFSAAKGSIIDLNGSLEQSQIAFTTMLGSGEKAETFLKDLQEFAANTPFEFPDLVSASKKMLAFGFESKQVVPLLTAVGDAVAAVGGGAEVIEGVTTAIGQMQAKGKVSAEEMGQLAERGIPAWDMLAKKLGVSVADAMDMVSKGQVKAATFVEAFQEGSAQRFGGMMEKQSATWSGALSTISDSLSMASAKAFKPFFDLISAGAIQLSKFVQSDQFNAWAESISGAVKKVIDIAKAFFEVFTGGELDRASEMLREFFSPSIAEGISQLVSDVGNVFDAVFNSTIPEAVGASLLILEDLGGLISTAVEEWASALAGWIDGADSDMMDRFGDLMVDVLDWVQSSALKIETKLLTWAGAFIDWVAPKIPPLLVELGGLLVKLIDWVVNTALPRLVTQLGEWGAAFIDWVGPRIIPLLAELGKLELQFIGWMVNTMLPAINAKIVEWAKAFIAWVPGAAVDLLFALGKLEVEFLGWIAGKVAGIASAALDLGKGLVKGIQDGIAGSLSGFWTWLDQNFVSKIPDFVKQLLNIHSPSGVFADIGRNIVEGLRVGMEGRLPSIDDVISRMVGTIATAGEVTDWLRAAMSVTGVGADWLGGLSRLAQWESSGNPRAINPIEVMGQHATGLMQMLPSTFRGHDLPGMGDIFNPVHNAAAAIKYIMATYGHVNRIPGVGSGNHDDFPGYAGGGWAGLHGPELAWLGEREPEYVIPRSQMSGSSGGGAPQSIRLDIAIGGRVAESIYIEGRQLAIRRGRVPAGSS